MIEVPLGVHLADDGRLKAVRPNRKEAIEDFGKMTDPAAAFREIGGGEDPIRVFRLIAAESHGPAWTELVRYTPNYDGGPPGVLRAFLHDSPIPHTIGDVIAFAADAPNVPDIELMAFEHMSAVNDWTAKEAPRIAWRFLRMNEAILRHPEPHDLRVIEECLDAHPLEGKTLGAKWREAAEKKLEVPSELEDPYGAYGASGPPIVPEKVRGKRFDELVNPFTTLERLADFGYEIESISGDFITILGAAPER